MNETVMEKENAARACPNNELRPESRNNSGPSIRSWPTSKNSEPASNANALFSFQLSPTWHFKIGNRGDISTSGRHRWIYVESEVLGFIMGPLSGYL
jgi:hypothetical protein